MNEITPAELFEQYFDTLGRCTLARRSQSDDELIYNISEEFDIGVRSLLHDESLARLHGAGLINDDAVEASREIRRRWLKVVRQPLTVDRVRNDPDLIDLCNCCESLKMKLSQGAR